MNAADEDMDDGGLNYAPSVATPRRNDSLYHFSAKAQPKKLEAEKMNLVSQENQ
jgi:hypothetical protein